MTNYSSLKSRGTVITLVLVVGLLATTAGVFFGYSTAHVSVHPVVIC